MTTVKLLNVPFESNYKDTVYFASKQEQESYMNSKVVKTFTDVTYQRKDNKIRVPAHIDTLYNCNYVAYTNTPYTNKTFYAFIVDMEYKQDDCTWITIQTDVLQSWMFDYTVKQSFVEREHVKDDTIGFHTLPEGLEVGEFITEDIGTLWTLTDLTYVFGVTKEPDGDLAEGSMYNGLYSGVKYYYFYRTLINDINEWLKTFDKEGIGESIQCMFTLPFSWVAQPPVNNEPAMKGVVRNDTKPYVLEYTSDDENSTLLGTRELLFDGYKPKNNKLLCFPYKHLTVSNNSGVEAVYHYELFKNGKIHFKLKGCVTPGGSFRLNPCNYKGIDENLMEGINLGKYPICNWTSDVYTNWLTQNSVNIGLSIASGVAQTVGGIAGAVATGGIGAVMGAGSAVSGVSSIASQLAQIHQMSFTPPQSKGNLNCGDVIASDNKNTFTFHHMSIKKEYAQIIDDYFQMFGYKVSRVKVPEKNHRPYFWYTKTIDVNIDGAIPNNDLQQIKQCYNNGITFWKPNANIGVYDVENSPV